MRWLLPGAWVVHDTASADGHGQVVTSSPGAASTRDTPRTLGSTLRLPRVGHVGNPALARKSEARWAQHNLSDALQCLLAPIAGQVPGEPIGQGVQALEEGLHGQRYWRVGDESVVLGTHVQGRLSHAHPRLPGPQLLEEPRPGVETDRGREVPVPIAGILGAGSTHLPVLGGLGRGAPGTASRASKPCSRAQPRRSRGCSAVTPGRRRQGRRSGAARRTRACWA